MRVIEDIMFTTDSVNPHEIVKLAFSFPGLPMLGCPHAYIAGGAFIAYSRAFRTPIPRESGQ